VDRSPSAEFDAFVSDLRPRLSRAFIAAFGQERGQEALAEAMAYAWEHFEALAAMANPGGYLYRVGQSRTRRRHRIEFPDPRVDNIPEVEPDLVDALRALSERQRACVVLVHGYGWTHQEVADLLALSRSSVQSHVTRGVRRLRDAIGVVSDA
jgi:DNA-directed RNA polymerase specialized sigma24 family protein